MVSFQHSEDNAKVTVYLNDGISECSFRGFITQEKIDGKTMYVLRPADKRQKPYDAIPVVNVSRIVYQY